MSYKILILLYPASEETVAYYSDSCDGEITL